MVCIPLFLTIKENSKILVVLGVLHALKSICTCIKINWWKEILGVFVFTVLLDR